MDNHLRDSVKLAVFCTLMPVENSVGNEHAPLTAIPTSQTGESPSGHSRTVHTPLLLSCSPDDGLPL